MDRGHVTRAREQRNKNLVWCQDVVQWKGSTRMHRPAILFIYLSLLLPFRASAPGFKLSTSPGRTGRIPAAGANRGARTRSQPVQWKPGETRPSRSLHRNCWGSWKSQSTNKFSCSGLLIEGKILFDSVQTFTYYHSTVLHFQVCVFLNTEYVEK